MTNATPGDKSRQAQFWYARQLAISGYVEDAKLLFDKLSSATVPFTEKTMVRGIIKDAKGKPEVFTGSIVNLEEEYGFVSCERFGFNAFFLTQDVSPSELEYLAVGVPMKFSVGFTLRGPMAQNISL